MKTVTAYEVNGVLYRTQVEAKQAESAEKWNRGRLFKLTASEIGSVMKVNRMLQKSKGKALTFVSDSRSIKDILGDLLKARVRAVLSEQPHPAYVRCDFRQTGNETVTVGRIGA